MLTTGTISLDTDSAEIARRPLEADQCALIVLDDVWHAAEPERFAEFRKATQSARLPAGKGLPGRVFGTGKAAWVRDFTAESDFPGAKLLGAGASGSANCAAAPPPLLIHLHRRRQHLGDLVIPGGKLPDHHFTRFAKNRGSTR